MVTKKGAQIFILAALFLNGTASAMDPETDGGQRRADALAFVNEKIDYSPEAHYAKSCKATLERLALGQDRHKVMQKVFRTMEKRMREQLYCHSRMITDWLWSNGAIGIHTREAADKIVSPFDRISILIERLIAGPNVSRYSDSVVGILVILDYLDQEYLYDLQKNIVHTVEQEVDKKLEK